MERKILTKDQILEAQDVRTERTEVPEWGGDVFVKALTGKEKDELERSVVRAPGERDQTNFTAKLVALCTVDSEGKRIFSFEDAEKLGEKNARALNRVFLVASRLSGFSQESVEELRKNSSPDQSEGSTSG